MRPSEVSKVALYDLDSSISMGGAEVYCLMTRTSFVGVLAGSVGAAFVGILVADNSVVSGFDVFSVHPPRKSKGSVRRMGAIQGCPTLGSQELIPVFLREIDCKVSTPCG